MRLVILILASVLFLGCNSDKKIEDQNTYLQEAVNKHTLDSKSKSKLIDSLKRNEAYLAYLLPALIDNDTLIARVKNNFILDDDERYNRILWDLSRVTNKNRNNNFRVPLVDNTQDLINIKSEDFFFHYLWQRFDRSAENIQHIFNTINVSHLTSIYQETYHDSGMAILAKALLTAYEELNKQPEIFETLNKRKDSVSVLFDPYYKTIVSAKVKELLAEDFSDDPLIQQETRYNWVYSFWMRRHNEGNDQLTYKLIKAVDATIISKVGDYYEEDEDDYEGY